METGAVDRHQIKRWAASFYAATRNGRLSLGNFYANSPDDPQLRRELAENLYEEETGRISGVGRCHMDVFCDFLAAVGISPTDAAALESPLGETQPAGRAIQPDDFYIELAAYGFSVEVPNAEFCQRMHDALRGIYGFSSEELRWFSMHAELDAHHGEDFQKYVTHVARQTRGLERLRDSTRELSASVKFVWDGCERWR